jgi:hypothetical protein
VTGPETEKDVLHECLQQNRDGLLSRLDGLTEAQLRRPMTPTATNLLGLVKHLAGLEYGYLGAVFGRPAPERMPWLEDGSIWQGADMWATPEESSEYIIGLYRRSWVHADRTIAELRLDDIGTVSWWAEGRQQATLRRLLVRMIGETARHAGHADIVRELIDGKGGVDQGELDPAEWERYVARVRGAAAVFE